MLNLRVALCAPLPRDWTLGHIDELITAEVETSDETETLSQIADHRVVGDARRGQRHVLQKGKVGIDTQRIQREQTTH